MSDDTLSSYQAAIDIVGGTVGGIKVAKPVKIEFQVPDGTWTDITEHTESLEELEPETAIEGKDWVYW